ncbi:mulatexin-like [Cynara cardunculus var. scolymus]|uniref:Uncharacterized protein n=1 Tax=Cynara cardunculus var. scolymus TaxID=59895 RepID=A0A103YAC0_CYNCS|nr:mulatexin-like [Cynara cardunculus var. scolymus]KVI05419.1 hypothetical protein Ccrd_016248 [Cynara cardunculus var. scolymus]
MSISPILLLILAVVVLAPIKAMNPRKLDQTTSTDTAIGGSTDDHQIKCGGCPCNNPCNTSPPPPPPSPPPPKKPSPTPGLNCPPPPSSYIYINGPPGNLYPINPYASSADHRVWVAPSLLVVTGVVGMLAFW